MVIFYPDNVPRADRLQQLINNIGVIQTDIANEHARMNEFDEKSRTLLDDLLKRGKIKTLTELKAEAMRKLTEDEKKEFEQAISSTKEVAQVTDTMIWVGLLVGGDKIISLGGKAIMAVVRGIASIQAVRAVVTAFVQSIPALAKGAAAVGEALANAAARAGQIAQKAETAVGSLVGSEGRLVRIFRNMRRIGKWLSWFGPVLVGISLLVEVIAGSTQKQQLIDGIHETQVIRLLLGVLKQQARNITEQMNTSTMYLSFMNKDKKGTAEAIGEEMTENIKEQDSKIDLLKLQEDFRKADNSTINTYFHDDLSVDVVVAKAKEEEKGIPNTNAEKQK